MGDSRERFTDNESGPPSRGARWPRHPRYIEEFGEGRVCVAVGCGVVLSRYNSGQRCWTHEQAFRAGTSESR